MGIESQINDHAFWMKKALACAQKAREIDEVPVGAVLVKDNKLIASGWNQPISKYDPTSHAEIECIREAARILNNYRLLDTTLYVTLEPCIMCAGAIIHARIKRVVFGAFDYKTGAMGSFCNILSLKNNHKVEVVSQVLEQECSSTISNFFQAKRQAIF